MLLPETEGRITMPVKVVFFFTFFIISFILIPSYSFSGVIEYSLTIDERMIHINNKTAMGITINGGIPGPVLKFKEGDIARIHVHNNLDQDTSIHWHGVLVPPDMDGVPYVSFPPIKPHSTFTYEFPVRQSGTYWYHSHTGLQEQSGVYGAIVIEPRDGHRRLNYNREYVILLSDWTEEEPEEILRTLKRGNEWYSIEKGNAQSIIGALKLGMLGDYFKRELLRMPPMDISDVAYDYFLANGSPEITFDAEPGDTILLRVINGSSMTYFYLEFAGGPMTVVSADGQDVEPVEISRLLIAVAETYDILIRIPSQGLYELRATAQDSSGFASIWLGKGERFLAKEVPKPNLYYFIDKITLDKLFALTPQAAMGMSDDKVRSGIFDTPGMKMEDHGEMKGMDHKMDGFHDRKDHGHKMENQEVPMLHHQEMKEYVGNSDIDLTFKRYGKKYSHNFGLLASDVASSEKIAVDGTDPERPGTPYKKLRSIKQTSFPEDAPVQEIRLTLDGDMERYVWFLDNKPLSESDMIEIKGGHIVRFIMINRTMMHHPMHLHGHFFRVVNSHGEYSPLKHTVDVAPMSTTVIEFYSAEPGDWFFHCHLLYHMESGMARIVHYEDFIPPSEVSAIRAELFKDSLYAWGDITMLSNMGTVKLVLSNTRNIFSMEGEGGWQRVDSLDWETIFTWDRYVNRFFTFFAGFDVLGSGDDVDDARIVAGIRYLLPLNIETRLWMDSDGGARFNFGKTLSLLPRLSIFGEGQYDTHDLWEGKFGISYTLSKAISIIGQWHSDYGLGAGLQYRF